MIYTKKQRRKLSTFWKRNGPVILVSVAIPLIMADILRHVLQDEGVWLACIKLDDGSCAWYSSAEYKAGEAGGTNDENLTNLSTIGILFTIVCTYSGFILLAFGTLWNANIMSKLVIIRARWRQLRGQMAAKKRNNGANIAMSELNDGDDVHVSVNSN